MCIQHRIYRRKRNYHDRVTMFLNIEVLKLRRDYNCEAKHILGASYHKLSLPVVENALHKSGNSRWKEGPV